MFSHIRIFAGRLLRKCLSLKKFKDNSIMVSFSTDYNQSTIFEGYNRIGRRTVLSNSRIGFATYIGSDCILPCCDIGKYCSIAYNVKVEVSTHPTQSFVSIHPAFYSTRKQSGFSFVKKQKFEEVITLPNHKYCKIGNDVWIGNNVTILGGLTIGDGACIAAGAIVTKDVEPYSIVGGIPARHIKYRFSKEQIDKLKKIKWWDRSFVWIKEHAEYFEEIDLFLNNVQP